jgi:hypothetical protein
VNKGFLKRKSQHESFFFNNGTQIEKRATQRIHALVLTKSQHTSARQALLPQRGALLSKKTTVELVSPDNTCVCRETSNAKVN